MGDEADMLEGLTPELRERLLLNRRMEGIVLPNARKARDARATSPFVHYTSADAALGIIKSKKLWMRNVTTMNDYRECVYGHEILLSFFQKEENRSAFCDTFDAAFPGLARDSLNTFDKWWHDIRFHTYLASLSEHKASEDQHGRLSMWRAFGFQTGRVALVFQVPFYSGAAELMNVGMSPVLYDADDDVHLEINQVLSNARENMDFLKEVGPQILSAWLFQMLVHNVVCRKHPGFAEELEWRVAYYPRRHPSTLMNSTIEVIRGVPQPVYKIALDGVADGTSDLEFSRIFRRLIIGPSETSWAMYEAFSSALEEAGVRDARDRVVISGIPIRA